MDLGIEVILELFSKESLQYLFSYAEENDRINTENSERIYALREEYLNTIEGVISFLQGKNQTFARQICSAAICIHPDEVFLQRFDNPPGHLVTPRTI